MKAIVFTRYGSPDGLELRDVQTPEPKAGELLVKIHASSVNSWDWEFLTGTPFVNRMMFGLFRPRVGKQRLGADIAGTVAAVGDGVTRFRPGDAVFGDLWDNWGGFAEYAVTPETAVEAKPANISFIEAATIPQAGVLALQAFCQTDPLEPSQTVMINGAGGGVGTFAVQLAKLRGADVTGIDAAHKLEVVHAAGADRVFDYAEQDFAQAGLTYDLIVDCQGTRPMSVIKRQLNPGGTYAMIGGRIGFVFTLWARSIVDRLTGESRRLRLVAEGPNKGLDALKALLEAGKLVPFIDNTFSLEDVPEALRYFGEGRHKGKIAISISD